MPNNNNKSGDLGCEATLWATADKLRGNLDTAEMSADIHSERYTTEGSSKANTLRVFWKLESDHLVGKLLSAKLV